MDCFIKIFLTTTHTSLREITFKWLRENEVSKKALTTKLLECAAAPAAFPEAFVWFFVKFSAHEDGIFDAKDKEIERMFLEASLVFMHQISMTPQRELGKKIYQALTSQRYLIIREMIQDAPIAYLKEFLLLSTKSPYFSSEDLCVLQSLAEVVQPSLKKKSMDKEDEILWTTAENFTKMKNKLKHLVEKEMVENAKEIEAARVLGDLRENSEYKFALEKRARLQEEIRILSQEVNKAQILTKDVIFTDVVNVGCKVSLTNESESVEYSILGPWDAVPEQNILSFQSKVAKQILGKRVGDNVQFKGKTYTISDIRSAL